jgi:hypothetical protein
VGGRILMLHVTKDKDRRVSTIIDSCKFHI